MELQSFRDNIYDAVYSHTRQLYWPSFAISIITALLFVLILIPLALNIFPSEILEFFQNPPKSFEDMEANAEKMEVFFKDNIGPFITFYIAALVLMVLALSYTYTVGYKISKVKLEGEATWLSALKPDFSIMLQLIYYGLILLIISFALFFATSMLAGVHFLLFFIALIIMVAFLLRFTIAAPAIVIAGMGISESIRYSLSKIGWSKSFKLLFFCFAALIAIFIIAIIVSLVFGLIFGTGISGQIISNSLMIFFNAAVLALYLAGSAGMLYRYGEFDQAVTLTEPDIQEEN